MKIFTKVSAYEQSLSWSSTLSLSRGSNLRHCSLSFTSFFNYWSSSWFGSIDFSDSWFLSYAFSEFWE